MYLRSSKSRTICHFRKLLTAQRCFIIRTTDSDWHLCTLYDSVLRLHLLYSFLLSVLFMFIILGMLSRIDCLSSCFKSSPFLARLGCPLIFHYFLCDLTLNIVVNGTSQIASILQDANKRLFLLPYRIYTYPFSPPEHL